MANVPPFAASQLEAICDVLGDTTGGLTGSEIARLLEQCRIPDPEPSITKRRRLLAALGQRQQADGSGNAVARFIIEAMAPVRYSQASPRQYEDLRHRLNKALAFCGYSLTSGGQLVVTPPAGTLDEARAKADRLRGELERRSVHPSVLAFCRPEFLDEDYFHAVLEATKSVAQKIRDKTGLRSDGSALVDDALKYTEPGFPLLALNSLQSVSDKNEHWGFMNLLKGTFQMFRNPTAHDPRVHRHVGEREALDLFSIVSFLHRRLDDAVPTGPPSTSDG